MPPWYPLVRAVKYYEGAYKVRELAQEPEAILQWALTAEAAECEGERIAREIYRQEQEMKGDEPDDD